jgi:hypothetical protein
VQSPTGTPVGLFFWVVGADCLRGVGESFFHFFLDSQKKLFHISTGFTGKIFHRIGF